MKSTSVWQVRHGATDLRTAQGKPLETHARMNEVLDATVALAEREKMSYLSFLDRLFEEEVAAKEKRRVDMAMRLAGLPEAKTIEEYDFSFHPHLDKKTVAELFDLTFLSKHENVIFLGPPGVGYAK